MRIAVVLAVTGLVAACSAPADSPARPPGAAAGPDWRIAQAEDLSFIVADLSRLERELKILEGEWPDGAYAMRVLLSGCGRMRQDGSMPSALVARLKAADQRSCELERNGRDPKQAWKPNRWLPPPPPDIDPAIRTD